MPTVELNPIILDYIANIDRPINIKKIIIDDMLTNSTLFYHLRDTPRNKLLSYNLYDYLNDPSYYIDALSRVKDDITATKNQINNVIENTDDAYACYKRDVEEEFKKATERDELASDIARCDKKINKIDRLSKALSSYIKSYNGPEFLKAQITDEVDSIIYTLNTEANRFARLKEDANAKRNRLILVKENGFTPLKKDEWVKQRIAELTDRLIDDRQSVARIEKIIKETSWRNNLIEQLFKSLEEWDKDIVEE